MESDVDLVRRSLAGETIAFGDLYARHIAAVAAHLRRALPGARLDFADTVQDAFVRAWCRLPQLRDPARFGAWVRAIAVAAAHDRLRATAREVPVGEPPDVAAAPDGADDTMAVRQALRALPPSQRGAVALCYLQDMSPGDAARLLGVPVTTIRGSGKRGAAGAARRRRSRCPSSTAPPSSTSAAWP